MLCCRVGDGYGGVGLGLGLPHVRCILADELYHLRCQRG